jgi:hypothetical protein
MPPVGETVTTGKVDVHAAEPLRAFDGSRRRTTTQPKPNQASPEGEPAGAGTLGVPPPA